jgi:hypothetical protein
VNTVSSDQWGPPPQPPDGVPPYGAQPAWTPPPSVPPYGGYPAPTPYPAHGPAPTNGMGVAGFVTALVGLVLFWVPILGLVLAGTGIVLSSVGMSQGRKTGASTGLSIAGLVCGIVGVIPALFFVLPAFFVNFS